MVKSNKFDYTGRTSSGPKLGKSIALDLEKRAEKKQRDAAKVSSSTRLSLKLAASTARMPKKERIKAKDRDRDDSDRDAKDTTLHKLDLKVPGKALTDDGFALLADGLENALTACQDLALVDLNLSDNALTTRSLARLAPIIQQSRYNLQTLDLSRNKIQVLTSTEAHEWELFLQAFRPCMTLRRLDLSDNSFLGDRAFEVLARVYSREPPVDPLPATGYQSLITLPDDLSAFGASSLDLGSFEDTPFRDGNAPDLPVCANGKTLADPWVLNYRCGLRSIPYLTLTNVGLSDTGALFLSYVLEQHYYPIQLVTETNATEATSLIRTYRQDANTKGIDWDHNSKTMTKDGLHLLQCAEKLRKRILLGEVDSITSLYMPASQTDVHDASSRRISNAGLRRPSLRSMQSADYSFYDKSEITSSRKKIQRSTIVNFGCDDIELWRASLSAIIQSRKVFLLAPVFSKSINGADSLDVELRVSSTGTDESTTIDNHLNRSLSALSVHTGSASFEENQSKRSYAATLMTTSPADSLEPELAITDVASCPVVPIVRSSNRVFRSDTMSRDNSTDSEASMVDEADAVLESPIECGSSSQDYVRYQKVRMDKLLLYHGGDSDGYRDNSMRCQLPLSVCVQILGYSMDAKDLAVLGEDKQRKAFAWGQKRETLGTEYEWRMRDESSQLLMLLASAECVEY